MKTSLPKLHERLGKLAHEYGLQEEVARREALKLQAIQKAMKEVDDEIKESTEK